MNELRLCGVCDFSGPQSGSGCEVCTLRADLERVVRERDACEQEALSATGFLHAQLATAQKERDALRAVKEAMHVEFANSETDYNEAIADRDSAHAVLRQCVEALGELLVIARELDNGQSGDAEGQFGKFDRLIESLDKALATPAPDGKEQP